MAKADAAQFSIGAQRYGYLVFKQEDGPTIELTPAKQNVAELVANGYTNQQIASAA